MITIVWEYQVKANHIARFEKIYGSNGNWVKLFRKGKGFFGTRLFQSRENPQLFVTIDQWESHNEYRTFLLQWKEEYENLDSQCSELTEHESCLGTFGIGFNYQE